MSALVNMFEFFIKDAVVMLEAMRIMRLAMKLISTHIMAQGPKTSHWVIDGICQECQCIQYLSCQLEVLPTWYHPAKWNCYQCDNVCHGICLSQAFLYNHFGCVFSIQYVLYHCIRASGSQVYDSGHCGSRSTIQPFKFAQLGGASCTTWIMIIYCCCNMTRYQHPPSSIQHTSSVVLVLLVHWCTFLQMYEDKLSRWCHTYN